MTFDMKWHGDEYKLRIQEAGRVAQISFGYEVAALAKEVVHKVTGNLSRSIDVFPGGTTMATAGGASTMGISGLLGTNEDVLVGSFLYYAKYEERLHPWLRPSFEAVRVNMPFHVAAALKGQITTATLGGGRI